MNELMNFQNININAVVKTNVGHWKKSKSFVVDTVPSTCKLINSNLETPMLASGLVFHRGEHVCAGISEHEPVHHRKECRLTLYIYTWSDIKEVVNWHYT